MGFQRLGIAIPPEGAGCLWAVYFLGNSQVSHKMQRRKELQGKFMVKCLTGGISRSENSVIPLDFDRTHAQVTRWNLSGFSNFSIC